MRDLSGYLLAFSYVVSILLVLGFIAFLHLADFYTTTAVGKFCPECEANPVARQYLESGDYSALYYKKYSSLLFDGFLAVVSFMLFVAGLLTSDWKTRNLFFLSSLVLFFYLVSVVVVYSWIVFNNFVALDRLLEALA